MNVNNIAPIFNDPQVHTIIDIWYILIAKALIDLGRLRSAQFFQRRESCIKNSLNQIKKIAWIASFIQPRKVLHVRPARGLRTWIRIKSI